MVKFFREFHGRLALLACLLICGKPMLVAQPARIAGRILDTGTSKGLFKASVVLLSAKDSIIIGSTRTSALGGFQLDNLDTGRYLLFCTYPGFADYVRNVSIFKCDSSFDLGAIKLMQKEHLLEDVIVRQQIAAVRFKGDTTEYMADSFKVRENASVEELLKKFPGIQVDRYGQITAQGETVRKVLVDGEEFFGTDPTLVTRNLQANMVDRVQLYDKKSDQAAFTGIDDGHTIKTLNLKLKEDKKYGYFGKVEGGGGTHDFYQGRAMYNSFMGKRKLALYGVLSNTGVVGLGAADQKKYNADNNQTTLGDNGVYYVTNNDDDGLDAWNGIYDGKGIPKVIRGGAHYDNKWNEDRQALNLNYRVGYLDLKGNSNTNLQNSLPGDLQFTDIQNSFHNTSIKHDVNGAFETKLSEGSSIKVALSETFSHKTTDNSYKSHTRDEDHMLNENTRNLSAFTDMNSFSGSVLWKTKFKKDRRTLSVNFDEKTNHRNTNAYLDSRTDFYNSQDAVDSTQNIHQNKINRGNGNILDTKVAYTEPLSKNGTLIVNYNLTSNHSTSVRNSYNLGEIDGGRELDSLYSSDYQFDQFINKGGLAYNYKVGKIRFQLGLSGGRNKIVQKGVYDSSELRRSFGVWYPSLNFNYSFSRRNNLTFTYNGSSSLPGITQIQPIRNNDDPLNIQIGNDQLRPGFDHNYNLTYINYKTFITYFALINYFRHDNPIVLNSRTDEQGRTIYQYFNLAKGHNISSDGTFFVQKAFENTPYNIKGYLKFNNNKTMTLVNDIENISQNRRYSFIPSIGISGKDDIYTIDFEASIIYNAFDNSVQKQVDTHYMNYSFSPSFNWNISKTLLVNTDVACDFQQKAPPFNDDFKRVIWNAFISKSFLKKSTLTLKLEANDLLNQNIGFSRSLLNNSIIQNDYTTIKRYFLLSAIWTFNNTHGKEDHDGK